MTVYSMTGYASLQNQINCAELLQPQTCIGLELRSVNSRFLDLNFKLCDELRAHESALRDLLQQRLKRGKVELRAFMVHGNTQTQAFTAPAAHVLEQLARSQAQIQACLPQAQALSVADVLRLAGSSSPKTEVDYGAVLKPLAQQVLQEFIASREREGQRMAQMLRLHTQTLRKLTQAAQPLIPSLIQAQQQRFLDRFAQALESAQVANASNISTSMVQERALSEAAAFALRVDVAEELTRLHAHLDEIETILSDAPAPSAQHPAAPKELGKRLDFMIQELHREANTLGSKSSTLELSRISVEMKVLIEQMREQVQNIE
jgi:uncharacterized protein (TIGR00255 family)